MNVQTRDFDAEAVAASAAASATLLPPTARFSLRAAEAERAALSEALGVDLPMRIGARAAGGGVEALKLGPDEWLALAPAAMAGRIAAACAERYDGAPHSLVDISDRELSVRIEGPQAAVLLTLGCPRDLDRLPVGEGRRTVFDDVAVVLWRDGERSFRLDFWRSFAPHVLSLLAIGCEELAL